MKSETDFVTLLAEHKRLFNNHFNLIINEMIERSQMHDMDKIYNKATFATYNQYFTELKQIPFGTPEYLQFENDYFWEAHMSHAQNRHHFYSSKNNSVNDPNLIDLIEAVIDIYVSNLQYNEEVTTEKVMEVLKTKGIIDIDLNTYIENTINSIK